MLDFLIKQPTPEQIAKFKVSTQAQKRLEDLLEKNRLGTISPAENSELHIYEQLDQLMILLKARDPIHSVWAYNQDTGYAVLITVYRPDPNKWINERIRKTD